MVTTWLLIIREHYEDLKGKGRETEKRETNISFISIHFLFTFQFKIPDNLAFTFQWMYTVREQGWQDHQRGLCGSKITNI